ncbi:helix-turn-helix transcriptional regulator [Isoptericola sp. NEAU-Y5]|uniref:Helix-turn-helix transcriptional regulator n=1 Tax=Isoptericola luteus TaxID=2879484 RepID=A0ABS7ZJ19_9MICO|nr:PadR family transcriptional regulator [Isoptericola sp. NEAU-Y5]MCA5894321.1 helix-turn-helix transcriptional regulator [Isoptericola sp. NEAU-Y5]
MAYVILGLLHLWPQSLYDLVKNFEAGVSLFYSASSGSIKRALDGLLERGAIEADDGDGPRSRKVYRVTAVGRREFHEWMTGPLAGPDAEAAALPRLYFLGLLAEPERGPVLAGILARIDADLARLTDLATQIEGVDVPDELRDVFVFQQATLDYGITSYRHSLEWFRDLAQRHADGSAQR